MSTISNQMNQAPLVVVLDDVRYGQTSCYGGPIATPKTDKLAASGLLYNTDVPKASLQATGYMII